MNNKNWYRQRSYAHFDKPLSEKDAKELVKDPKRVSQHAFWPLIVRPIKSISRKKASGDRREIKVKNRPIAYAAHSDSHIYAYYAQVLSSLLEKKYKADTFCDEAVLAYRVFNPPKSNINFAFEAFKYIKTLSDCEVIAIDVEGFFDNLDPFLLKKSWQKLMQLENLPEDHYAVFKACTRSYGVSLPKLRDVFKGKARRKRGKDNAVICSPSEFRSKVVPELKPLQTLVSDIKGISIPSTLKGIPQGLPISAVLANLYMLNADRVLARYARKLGGRYQRYSDDILFITPIGKGCLAERAVIKKLKQLGLKIQNSKTQHAIVRQVRASKALEIRCQRTKKPVVVSYLGFDFDGNCISIRSSTISKFMFKAVRAIRRAEISAKNSKTPLKKRLLYARLTTLGYGQVYGSQVYAPGSISSKSAPRLGFFKYMRRAENITMSVRVKKQIRQVENRVHRLIHEAELRVKSVNEVY